MPRIDPELLRRQLDEQLRHNVESAYQDYLTKVRALETVVRAQSEIAATLPPLPLAGLLADFAPVALLPAVPIAPAASIPSAPPAMPAAAPALPPGPAQPAQKSAAPAPARPAKSKRPKADPFEVHDAILDVLDRLPEVFDKNDLFRALGYEPKRSNLRDALFKLVVDRVLKVEWYALGNKPSRYRRVGVEGAAEAEE